MSDVLAIVLRDVLAHALRDDGTPAVRPSRTAPRS